MHDQAVRLAGSLIGVEPELEQEFEVRLVESSTLAFRVAFSVLRHRQDAEDIAQEAFVKAYRGFRQLRDRDRFRAWLVRMTWRLAIDRQRGNRRGVEREYVTPAADATTSVDAAVDNMASRERAAQLWKAIDSLPEKLRVVIVLAGIEEHNLGEVAKLLNLPEGTVKSRMFLAR